MSGRRGWTEAEVEVLDAGYKAGLSASEIAAKLPGKSRNAVIGRIGRNRARYPARASQSVRYRARRAALSRPARPLKIPDKPVSPRRRRRSVERVNQTAIETGSTLKDNDLKLGDGRCRWPIGDPAGALIYCGMNIDPKAPSTTTQSYCKGHGDVARRNSYNLGEEE